MRVTGVGIGFIDSEPEATAEFNRWYDLDHLPENVALPGVLGSRRYVATPELKALRGPGELEQLGGGKGTFCTTYLFGSEDLAAVQADMHALAVRLAKEGRMFKRARSAFYAIHRLTKVYVRQDLRTAPEAAPFLGHTGLYLSMGVAASPAHRAQVDEWYDQVHVPDILDVPGFLACLRLVPVNPEHAGRFLHLFLLGEEPAKAVEALRARIPVWQREGRLPTTAGTQRPLLRAPYRFITPLQYPFAKP